MQQVRAAVSRGDDSRLGFEDLSIEPPREDEVLVEVDCTAICHTDILAAEGVQGARKPAVFGHEGAGIVRAVGARVTEVAPGDRVVMTQLSCGECERCLSGRTNYCQHSRTLNMLAGRLDGSSCFCGSDVHGHFFGQSSFATHSLAHRRNVLKVPEGVPLAVAAAMSCGVLTGAGAVLNVAGVRPDQAVVVTGAGGVGLGAVMAARLAGARRIVAVDLMPARLDLARQVGATHGVVASDPEAVAQIRAICGNGADVAIEASGAPPALKTAIDSLGLLGTCVIVGAARGDIPATFPWRTLMRQGQTIRGSLLGDSSARSFMPKLFGWYLDGRFPVDRILTHYAFEDINRAMAEAAAGGPVKPVLHMKPQVPHA